MPTPPEPYIVPNDLRAALGASTFLQIFDDDSDGSVPDDEPSVVLVIERAHTEVLSYLPRIYDSLPDTAPKLLRSAELDYAVALAFERHPEYVRAYGEEQRDKRWKRAEAKMERIAEAVQQLTDNAPEPKPGVLKPVVFDNARRMIIDSPDGTDNGGDFA